MAATTTSLSDLRRVMKVGSFAEELQVFSKGVMEAMPGLTLLSFMLMIYLVVFASFLNMLEDEAHRNYPCGSVDTSPDCMPEGKDGFESIPASIWFVLATLTTVGYGDVYPVTIGGKLVGMTCMLTGEKKKPFPFSSAISHHQPGAPGDH